MVQRKMDDLEAVLNKHGIKDIRCGAGCGNGWVPLIDNLITELCALGWDKHVEQIKEKFGGLRFYIGGATPEMHDLINRAEDASIKICEECGKEGKRSDWGKYWIKTLCPKHGKEYGKQ